MGCWFVRWSNVVWLGCVSMKGSAALVRRVTGAGVDSLVKSGCVVL